jgi:hypothetical protein
MYKYPHAPQKYIKKSKSMWYPVLHRSERLQFVAY